MMHFHEEHSFLDILYCDAVKKKKKTDTYVWISYKIVMTTTFFFNQFIVFSWLYRWNFSDPTSGSKKHSIYTLQSVISVGLQFLLMLASKIKIHPFPLQCGAGRPGNVCSSAALSKLGILHPWQLDPQAGTSPEQEIRYCDFINKLIWYQTHSLLRLQCRVNAFWQLQKEPSIHIVSCLYDLNREKPISDVLEGLIDVEPSLHSISS